MMRCKSTEFPQVSDFLSQLKHNITLFYNSTAGEILRLQIDSLRAKIEFLEEKLFKVKNCPDGKEINEFLNYIGDFANSAACLTCLYCVKESDYETASEMNIAAFDMLQKFIPYASHIIPLYVGILKACDLQPMSGSGSFLLSEAVESFVDFFFEHLAIVLKDDFLFLRDRLMFLFTFLTDPPCENVEEEEEEEEEGESIRNQIYAILREDAYLLLSFDEMSTHFSDKKALLSSCMIRIDVAIAKIGQLYRGSSVSRITLEVEKMEYDYFASVDKKLSSFEKQHAEGDDKEELQLYMVDLRFLRVFFLCFATWDDTDEEINVKLRSMITSFRGIWGVKEGERLLAHRLHAMCTRSITDWHPLAFELQEKIHQSKLEAEAWCVNMFHQSPFQFKASTSYKILEFLDSILANLNDLVIYKASEIVQFKKQIETLEEKLMFLKNFMKLALNC